MAERKHFREKSRWHERYEDWRAELKAIVAHEPIGRFATATEEQLMEAWKTKKTPWQFFDDNLSDVGGHNLSIDDIPVLGEDE